MVSRREVLQGLIVSMGGATALSACGGIANVIATSPAGSAHFYTESEMALLSRICELIIPRTETPGALDVNVPGYLDSLMSEWASTDTKNQHRQSLDQISADLDERVRGSFLMASNDSAEQALTALDAKAFEADNTLQGYRTLKGYITQAFFATEGGATEELKWVAFPGRWDPSVDIPA